MPLLKSNNILQYYCFYFIFVQIVNIKEHEIFIKNPVHTKNDNYKDTNISVHTSERYRLFIRSAR